MSWLSCVVSNVLLALLLALAAWVTQRWLRRPAIAHILWVLMLVKLVTPPLVSVPLRGSPGTLACTLGACGCEQHARTQTIVRDTLPWVLLAAWSAGAGATGWTAWRRWTRLRRLMAHASPAPPEWQSLAARLASELSMRRPPGILAVPGRLPPLVIPGRRQPLVLLPMALMSQLNASQKVALLLHELVHIKRGDHLVRILELTVGVAYWWLPIVGSIGRQLRACEETCCDAAVVAHLPQVRRDYARLLLDVIDFTNPLPGQAVPLGTAMSAAYGLERRLLAILDATKGTRRSWPAGAFAVVLACAILPCALHYDLAGRPVPAATSAERKPDAGTRSLPSGDREDEPSTALCCPS
ncbi:MAG TPA: M56 family metallopeptidase [Pirellulales bacterium]|nr:M56 family metallopeptidase [Pirellulales bacterium]